LEPRPPTKYRSVVAEIRDATPADLDDVYVLLDARSRRALGISEVKLDHLRNRWAQPGFTIGDDNWVAQEDGRLVGYAALDTSHELEHAASDASVADALLARAEERAHARGFATITLIAVAEDEPLQALAARNDFSPHLEVLRMWRALNGDLPEPRWPDGVAVLSYEPADAQRVHALLDDAYSAWDNEFIALPHDDWVARVTGDDGFDPAFFLLAERSGELVACALNWKPFQQRGWVKDLVVRVDARGAGLAKALLHEGFRRSAAAGASHVGLKVIATNPTGAVQLYERAGFATDRRYQIWLKRL
jgi:ribosomal protein S18 acetylase RimI-like enzyme